MIQCHQCLQYFHRDCVKCLPKPLLFADIFLEFTCSVCTQHEERYARQSMAWITVVQLVLYNLMRRQDPDTDYPTDRDHQYFRWKEDLCAFIDEYWEYLHPGKQSKSSFIGQTFAPQVSITYTFIRVSHMAQHNCQCSVYQQQHIFIWI